MTSYVSSWIKALENDPKEIRAAAVDAQRIADWLMAREPRGDEQAEHARSDGGTGEVRNRDEPNRRLQAGCFRHQVLVKRA